MTLVTVWILSYNIYQRNIFLDEYFPQVMEEIKSTTLAYTLSIVCPAVFIIAPFVQYGLFLLYHKYGHPWSEILNSQTHVKKSMEESSREEQNRLMENQEDDIIQESLVPNYTSKNQYEHEEMTVHYSVKEESVIIIINQPTEDLSDNNLVAVNNDEFNKLK